MQTTQLSMTDQNNRTFPVMVYLPDNYDPKQKLKTVVFGNGFQEQERFRRGLDFYCKNYTYLAKFFTEKGYAFVSLQFEILGDSDTLEGFDMTRQTQIQARTHLWVKDEKITLFVLEELKKSEFNLDLDKFIIGGHSNGGDVAKYFTNHYPERVTHTIILDGRRCPIADNLKAKFLMFEAEDTSTDVGVLPSEGPSEHHRRENVEWVIVKPRAALHRSYTDKLDIPGVKEKVCNAIEWFLGNF